MSYLIYRFCVKPTSFFGIICAMICGLLLVSTERSPAQVVINEIAADNASSLENGGAFPDWLELYNLTTATVNIGGWGLTNITSKNPMYTFPANTLIGPQAFLVVWCDSANTAPGLHTGWSISGKGATIALFNNVATLVDSNAFGLQITDLTIGRVPDGSAAWQLTTPSPGLANRQREVGSQLGLRYNEWMSTNSAGADKDWLEVYNTDPLPVPLGGLVFSGKTNNIASEKTIPALSFIDGLGFIRFWCDSTPKSGADHLNFKLSSSSGEILSIYSAAPSFLLIERVSFPGTNDPMGMLRNESMGRLPDGGTNIVKFPPGSDTPGTSNFLPLTNVVINEILSHTDPPIEDAIELYNTTAAPVDISNWWLSNSKSDPYKFRIPVGTTIAAGGYKVFYEQRGATGGFNTSGTGNAPDFTLNSAHGDQVLLYTADSSGRLLGYRTEAVFGSAAHGVPFTRYVNSVGAVDITAESALTFGHDNPTTVQDFRLGTGLPNAYPVVGPIVINEIMYHPPNFNVTNDNFIDEYIELHNIRATNVPLYFVNVTNRPGVGPIASTDTWKLDDAVTYTFPGAPVVPPGGFVLVVNFDPVTNLTQLADFRSKYGIPSSFTNIFGPYAGNLKNSHASVKLYKPDTIQEPPHPDAGFLPYVLVDMVNYSDSPPWPREADGNGASLQRRHRTEYGNDPINWGALTPTPGRSNVFSGTIQVDRITRAGSRVDIFFTAQQGQPYTVEFKNDLSASSWTILSNIVMSATATAQAEDLVFSPTGGRFYRVRTPMVP